MHVKCAELLLVDCGLSVLKCAWFGVSSASVTYENWQEALKYISSTTQIFHSDVRAAFVLQ